MEVVTHTLQTNLGLVHTTSAQPIYRSLPESNTFTLSAPPARLFALLYSTGLAARHTSPEGREVLELRQSVATWILRYLQDAPTG